MKILINGGSGGWVEYVLDGTPTKPRDKNKIEIIDGDFLLTKSIYENDMAKERYTRVVLAFQGKQDKETMKQVYEEFNKLFFIGFKKDEYNTAAVLHTDTDNNHIHICIPKLNLKNDLHNNYYFDRVDRERINLIRDYLIEKYNLLSNEKTDKELVKEDNTLKRIEKWREEHKQPKIKITTRKRSKDKAIKDIKNYLEELDKLGILASLDDTRQIIEDLNLKVIKQGHDIPNDFYYFTLVDKTTNQKLRIKGEYFNEQFYKHRTENTRYEKQCIETDGTNGRGDDTRIREIKEKLDKENKHREQLISSRNRRGKNNTQHSNNKNPLQGDGIDLSGNNNSNNNSNPNYEKSSITKHINTGEELLCDKSRQIIGNSRPKHILHTKGVGDDKLNSTNKNIQTSSSNITAKRETRVGKLIKSIKQRTTRDAANNRGIITQLQLIRTKLQNIKRGIFDMKQKQENIYKTDINLIEYASSCGFYVDKNRSGRHSATMRREDTKIVVKKNSNNQFIYFDLFSGKGGSIIDFYKNFVNDRKKFWQILKDLKSYLQKPSSKIKYSLTKSDHEYDKVVKEWDTYQLLDLENTYLTKVRKISKSTLEVFQDTIKIDKANHDNLSFIHKNYIVEDERMKIDTCGIEKKNNNFKQHVGKKGLWGKNIGKSETIYLFESPIDAMSYYELEKKDGMYISLGGSPSPQQLDDLKNVVDFTNRNITICFDNDEGGKKLNDRVCNFFLPIAPDRVNEWIKPKKKDWNEDLKQYYKKKKNVGVGCDVGRGRSRDYGFDMMMR